MARPRLGRAVAGLEEDYSLDFADTVAASYSARPYHLPTVSTPLEWREVNSGLEADNFTIHIAVQRFEKKNDPFVGLFNRINAFQNSKHLTAFL